MKSPVWEKNLIQDPFTAKIPDCDESTVKSGVVFIDVGGRYTSTGKNGMFMFSLEISISYVKSYNGCSLSYV